MNKKKVIIPIVSILSAVTVLMGTFLIYSSIYYHTNKDEVEKYISKKDVAIDKIDNKTLEIKGSRPQTGIIFYPGAKVEYTAYEPLLSSLADQNCLTLLLHMPFNLAVLNIEAANGYIEKYPYIEHWYLMGHSLGGAIASQYILNHEDQYDGLILLGSFPYKDLSTSSLKLLSLYGSEDKVLNMNKYDVAKAKWPKVNKEYVIEGGCHSYFGMYGAQKGDGTPSISNVEQIDVASKEIINFIKD